MALDKNVLTQAIKDIRNIDVPAGEESADIMHDLMADRLAKAIDEYIRSGDVVISSGSSMGTYKVT